MIENKSDSDTATLMITAAQDNTDAANNAVSDADGTARKRPRPASTAIHLDQFLKTTPTVPSGQQSGNLNPSKPSYAGAAASAATKVNSTNPASIPSVTATVAPSICLQAMINGAQMLRTASGNPPVSPSDTTTALPALGILIKSLFFNKKHWRHFALFGCVEIEIVAASNTSYPSELDPRLHPGRMVCIRSDLLNKTPIIASFLHVVTSNDMQKLNDLRILTSYLPDGFGKIQYEPTGMHVKVMSSTYKSGADDKHTYLRPIYNHLAKAHLLIPVSNLHLLGNDSPALEQALLPEGTHVHFKFGIKPGGGGSFAFNLRLVTILPFDNCYGYPPTKMESMVKLQPGGFQVDLHVAPFGIALRSELCDPFTTHIKDRIPHDSMALYITHSNDAMTNTHFASVGELDRAFRASSHKCNWNLANLDQLVEMILTIKKSRELNEHKASKKHFTVVFTLANQNQQNTVTKTIADSYNLHKHGGHSLLHAKVGVLLALQPTSHSYKGIVAQINAAQILSKAHCTALLSTHTFPPGYAVPYVKMTPGGKEQVLGYSHTHISILTFADNAKDSKLRECTIELAEDDSVPIQISNEVIPIQWQPGSLKDAVSSHPILRLLEDKDFLRQAEVNRPTHDRKKKHEDAIRTAYIKPRPGYNQAVLATLLMRKDILILPNHSLDDDGFLLRFSRPYPAEAFELVRHPAVKYAQFLSPYALRIIYNDGFNNEIIPELLKLDKTVAHNESNISLVPTAYSPWNEVIANGVHSTLGRTLLPPSMLCPHSSYIGGFTGFPTTDFLQNTLFRNILGVPLPVVDSPEETEDGGVFIQYLKSSIRPSTLHAKDVTLSIYSINETTRAALKDMENVIVVDSLGSLYPVTSGHQFLSVQATAVSLSKGEAMGEEALNLIQAKLDASYYDSEEAQNLNDHDHHPHGDEQKEEEFVESRNRKSARNKTNPGNTNSNKQQPKTTKNATAANQQALNQKANQYSELFDDVELFDDPAVILAATQRTADTGDFDTSKDWRITNYLIDKWTGYRPDQQIKSIAKLVVTIWAREHPDYHEKQLGTNFTGGKKLGGLLAAIGRSRLKSLQKVTTLLRDNVRHCTNVDQLYSKLVEIKQDAQDLPESSSQQQAQQQPANQPQNSPPNGNSPKQPPTRTSNKTITPSIANKSTINSYFNPLNTIPLDLTVSQEEKSNTMVEGHMQLDHDHKSDDTSSRSEQESRDDGHGNPSDPEKLPPSPTKIFPISNGAIGSASSAALNLSLHGGYGGMPATVFSTTDQDPTAFTIGSFSN